MKNALYIVVTISLSLVLSVVNLANAANRLPGSVKQTEHKPKTEKTTPQNPSELDEVVLYTKNKEYIFKKHTTPVITERDSFLPRKNKQAGVSTYIVGGEPTPAGERGYQVSLFSLGEHLCGGSLIAREWVLTAAHCVLAKEIPQGVQIMLGSNDLNSPDAMFIPVVQVLAHEQYNVDGNSENDIALLRLAMPAPDHIPTLQLANEEFMSQFGGTGEIATVSGWGYTSTNNDETDILQQVDLPIYDQEECAQAHLEEQLLVLDTMLCAGYPEGGRDSCYGDSGGPLTISTEEGDYSIGVVSWGGWQCAFPGLPGVYTRTASYLEWIEETLLTPAPPNKVALSSNSQNTLNDTFIGGKLYSLPIQETVELHIEVNASSPVELRVYNAVYQLPSQISCIGVGTEMSKTCRFPILGAGDYLLEVSTVEEHEVSIELNTSHSPLLFAEDTTIADFGLLTGQTIITRFDITEEGQGFDVQLNGDNGDTDLYVIPEFDTDWVCFSESFSSAEQCSLEEAPVGTYSLYLVGYQGANGLTLTFDLLESVVEPPLPQAICQHSVITQLGKYFIANIDIYNVSDEYLTDWQITWDYQQRTDIKLIQNAIITSRSPYVAEASQPGLAIAPGGSAKIYMLAESASRIAENPAVTGNYCF